jgi:hypothetical protein
MKPPTPWTAREVSAIVGSGSSKSDKMRALARLGLPRARIADALGVRYQFVRNVLESDRLRTTPDVRPAEGVSEAAAPYIDPTPGGLRVGNIYRLTIGPGGVVTLPREVMESFKLRVGGVVVGDFESDRFTLISAREGMRRARALVPQWRPGEPMISEELIADRRREASEEQGGG